MANQILTFKAVEEYCNEHLDVITFLSIEKQDMVQIRADLEKRYSLGGTDPGTRSCHHFQPVSSNSIKVKQRSHGITSPHDSGGT